MNHERQESLPGPTPHWRWLVFLLVQVAVTRAAWGEERLDTLLAQGDAHYQRFENAAALEVYEQAYEHYGDDFELLVRLARTSHDLGLDRAADKNRPAAQAHLEEALVWARRLAAKHPQEAESYTLLAAASGNLARFLGGKKKVEIGKATAEYANKAIALDPGAALPHAILGIFYREVAELNWVQRTFARVLFGGIPRATHQDAVAELSRAVELDPNLTFAHFELALTYEAMGQRRDALAHLQRVLDLPTHTSQDRRNQDQANSLAQRWAE